jgi:PAS domain S-box-containing protein
MLNKISELLNKITSGAYWKETAITLFMVTGYVVGNGVEMLTGKVTDDPPALWITGIIIGLVVLWVAKNKRFSKYTVPLFKLFLIYLNFNVIFYYVRSTTGSQESEFLTLLFSYMLFIITSFALETKHELIFFSIVEVVMFAVMLILYKDYNPILIAPGAHREIHWVIAGIVLTGNYLINFQRIKLTQATTGANVTIQFRSISENSRDTQVILNRNFQFVYLNPAVKSLTGYDANSLINKEVFDLISTEDTESVRNALEEVKQNTDTRVNREYRIKKADGTYVWVESIFSSFDSGPNKKGDLIFAETRDIEARKKLEEEIQQQLKVEEMLIKHSNQFINVDRTEIHAGIDYALGEFGNMLQADAVMVFRMQGKLHDEFQSSNQWFSPKHINLIQHFNLIVRINQQLISFLRGLKGEKASWGNYISGEQLHQIELLATNEIQGKKFYLIPMQSGNIVNGFILFVFDEKVHHEQSSFFGLIGSMVANAFTRLRTETRLYEAQLTNEYILRALPDWLYIVDGEGEFTGSNDYSTLEPYFPDYNLVGKKFNEVLPPDIADTFSNTLNEVKQTDKLMSFEYQDTTIQSGHYFKVIIAPFKPGEFLIIIRDITDLKQAQLELQSWADKLAHSNKELEEFAYVVSHDMKQPIRTITSYLGLLKKKYGSQLDETANEFIQFSIDGANKMSDLIRDILEYSRVDQQVQLTPNVSLNNIVDKVLKNLTDTIERNKAQVVVDDLPNCTVNETMLGELFQNLIENGIKYNRSEHKKVTVKVRDTGNFWEFEIADNGIGFDQQYAEKIFKIFTRLHTNDEFQGTGIGLAICHKVVVKHGGKIWAKSIKGEGSHFYFTLPKQ